MLYNKSISDSITTGIMKLRGNIKLQLSLNSQYMKSTRIYESVLWLLNNVINAISSIHALVTH
jgi:hypothetical protein